MMRLATGTVVTAVVLALSPLLMFLSQPVLLGLCFAGLAGVGLWQLGRCHHPRPLALLPPVSGPDGERTTAHWFCAACGRTWPAFVDRPRPPVQIFKGYDESKAREAAKRAATLEERLRVLAVQRAGMKKPPSNLPVRRPAATGPVPIHSHRAVR